MEGKGSPVFHRKRFCARGSNSQEKDKLKSTTEISIKPPLKIDRLTHLSKPGMCVVPSGPSDTRRGGPVNFDNPGGVIAPLAVKRGLGRMFEIYLIIRNWLYRGLFNMRLINKKKPYMIRMRPQVHHACLISRRAGGASRFMKGVTWNS